VTHRSFAGNNLSHPVQLLRQDGTLAEEISFASDGRLSASATDVEEFIQDQWTLNEHLAISLGGRLTNETVGRAAAFARASAWPIRLEKSRKPSFALEQGFSTTAFPYWRQLRSQSSALRERF